MAALSFESKLESMNATKCPCCDNELSIWVIGKEFICGQCKHEVVGENFTLSLVVGFLGWWFLITPLAWILIKNDVVAFIIDVVLGILFVYFMVTKNTVLKAKNET